MKAASAQTFFLNKDKSLSEKLPNYTPRMLKRYRLSPKNNRQFIGESANVQHIIQRSSPSNFTDYFPTVHSNMLLYLFPKTHKKIQQGFICQSIKDATKGFIVTLKS
jgi:hypothetical protein